MSHTFTSKTNTRLPFITLLFMISFASVNAGLFTPGLPDIALDFKISTEVAQQTITWFLVGYAAGQLLYGPLTHRFGRKPTLFIGITLQILSSLLCVWAGVINEFWLLILGRFLVALGSGVGLKMTYTIVNETYEPKLAGQKISYLMLAFCITPGLGIALGGFLTEQYGWASCFYAGAIYGLLLLGLVLRFPAFNEVLDKNALQIKHIAKGYTNQFKNSQLVLGGLIMGGATGLIYVFSAIAPFIAINFLGMESDQYGAANILPQLSAIAGLLMSAQLIRALSLKIVLGIGVLITGLGIIVMFGTTLKYASAMICLFVPMMFVYFGISFVTANTSSIVMSHVNDKTYGAAVMSFINLAAATLIMLGASFFTVSPLLLPLIYFVVWGVMVLSYAFLKKEGV